MYYNCGEGRGFAVAKTGYAYIVEILRHFYNNSDVNTRTRKNFKFPAVVHDLKREGYERILKYGIAFHKKSCEVAMDGKICES